MVNNLDWFFCSSFGNISSVGNGKISYWRCRKRKGGLVNEICFMISIVILYYFLFCIMVFMFIVL